MKLTLRLVLLACLVWTNSSGKAQEDKTPSSPPPTETSKVNAATIYRRAFAVMPVIDEEAKKLLNLDTVGQEEAKRALVLKAEPALKLAYEASRVAYCDWKLDLREGPMLALPHLGQLQDLARLALVKARLSDAETAVAQHEFVLRLERHAGASPLCLCRLVEISIAAMGINSAASMMPNWTESMRLRVQVAAIGCLTASPSVSECVPVDGKGLCDWFSNALEAEVKKQGASLDAGAWLEQLFRSMANPGEIPAKSGQPSAGLFPGSVVEVRLLIASLRAQYQELGHILALPRDPMNEQLDRFEQKLKVEPKRNVLILNIMPVMVQTRWNELRAENLLALFRAAFAVQAKGESALPASLATYRKTKGGFELTGKEQFRGKANVLTVGVK